ncbi:hypothetical protein FHS18_005927 [Paenibacillus phyllosphaerae]|uniref:DUF4367 domain-containing protein n=1 Tax=Paenibacillus phyllosphaerae TaxID=274593 RepID=A0A7W5B441_9BACL|nr:hypothetical protein [Paenibacillus phyllosphaerae]MBB3113814.1 hypothetical protein [Paenibacillus phyllosphaerae]
MESSSVGKDEDLTLNKAYLAHEYPFKQMDLTDKVMRRIEQGSVNERKAREAGGRKWLRPATVLTGMLGLILFASVSGYAATKLIEIRDRSGQVVMKTIDYPHYPPDATISQQMSDYDERVKASLEPGEFAAYYINDEAINEYDKLNPIKFVFQPVQYKTYAEFAEAQTAAKGPSIPMPAYVPEGLHLLYGQVHPKLPHSGEGENSTYSQVKQRLIERASQAPTSADKLFMEKLDWTESGHSQLYFADEQGKIVGYILASFAMGSDVWPQDGDVVEKVKIGEQQEGIYHQVAREDGLHSLAWFDSQRKIAYNLLVKADSGYSKEEMMRMAASMLNG